MFVPQAQNGQLLLKPPLCSDEQRVAQKKKKEPVNTRSTPPSSAPVCPSPLCWRRRTTTANQLPAPAAQGPSRPPWSRPEPQHFNRSPNAAARPDNLQSPHSHLPLSCSTACTRASSRLLCSLTVDPERRQTPDNATRGFCFLVAQWETLAETLQTQVQVAAVGQRSRGTPCPLLLSLASVQLTGWLMHPNASHNDQCLSQKTKVSRCCH